MGRIPSHTVEHLTRRVIEAIWMGPAQTGGHRSDEVRFPQVLDSVVRFARESASVLPATTVAGTVLYRFADEQPFGDCNKRTGLILAVELMQAAGYRLTRPAPQIWRYLNLFATNHPGREEFLQWFSESFSPGAPAQPPPTDE